MPNQELQGEICTPNYSVVMRHMAKVLVEDGVADPAKRRRYLSSFLEVVRYVSLQDPESVDALVKELAKP